MTTAPPDTHTVFLGFLSSHPTQYQTDTRLRTEDVCFQLPAPVACCANPNSKTSLTFSCCSFIKPAAPIPTNLPFLHVSGGLQLVGDSAAGELQTNMPRRAEEIRKVGRFPLMQSIQS